MKIKPQGHGLTQEDLAVIAQAKKMPELEALLQERRADLTSLMEKVNRGQGSKEDTDLIFAKDITLRVLEKEYGIAYSSAQYVREVLHINLWTEEL